MRQDAEKQADLFLIRQTLQQALPEAEERISWSMPTCWKEHNILHFAASKKHIGFYPGPKAVETFKEALKYGILRTDLRFREAELWRLAWIKEPYAFHTEKSIRN